GRNLGEENGTSEGNLVALACSRNSEVASRPVLQRQPGHLRPPDPAEPRHSGRGAGRPSRGPAPLEDGPRRVFRRPRGHVARESIALNRGASLAGQRQPDALHLSPKHLEGHHNSRSEQETALLLRPPCLDEPTRNGQCVSRLSPDLRVTAENSGPASRKRTILPIMSCIAPLPPIDLEDGSMSEYGSNPMHRREFIQAGAAATAAAATLAHGAAAAQVAGEQAGAAKKKTGLPRRVLGKTGAEVTIINAGTWRAPGSLDRLLRYSFSRGVRYYDTAAGYKTEDRFKAWFAAQPEVRKQIFLATKDHVREPGQMVNQVDKRLAALGTDYIDLLFFHGLGSNQVDWPKSKEMKAAAEAIKKTGKVRFVGFSTHDR